MLDSLNINRATIVGHSMGGFVAQRIAALAPDRVSGLILVATAATCRNPGVLQLRDAFNALEDPVSPEFARDFQLSTIHRPVTADFLEQVIRESLKVPAHVWKAAFTSLVNDPPFDVPASCPTRILWGDRDAVFSRGDQAVLLQRIPQAELSVHRDVGHAVHWELPEQLARELVGIPA